MARHAHQPGQVRRLLAALALTLAAAGCSSKHPVTGGRYVEYPARLELQTVLSAAEASLRSRGYVIESRAATDDRGEVIARPPTEQDKGWFSTALYVRASRDLDGQIRLTVARWPAQKDDHEANTALHAIVSTLGIQPLAIQDQDNSDAQTNAAER
jgi:hypothetical protein